MSVVYTHALLSRILRAIFSEHNVASTYVHKDEGMGVTPEYKTIGAAGCDIAAAIDIGCSPYQVTLIPTEVRLCIPQGHFGLLKERSSIGKAGLIVVGGIIDCDYRGEISVLLYNTTGVPVRFKAGDRIANLIAIPYVRMEFNPTSLLPPSQRGESGFGSTGG